MPCQSEETQTYGQPAYIAEHGLKRQFSAHALMQKLVTDITYLPFSGKMLYLSNILNLFNGEIVARIYQVHCSIAIKVACIPLRPFKKL